MSLLIFFIGMIVFSLYMMYRNNLVYKARLRIGERIHKYNYEIIQKGTYKKDAMSYNALDRLYSYSAMLFIIWKPVEIMEEEIILDLKLHN